MHFKPQNDDIQVLDEWYQRKCNGLWEHRWGFRVETCDNPGWLATFDDLPLKQSTIAALRKSLLAEFGAELIVDGEEVRVFARSLKICLTVAAKLVDLAGTNESGRDAAQGQS